MSVENHMRVGMYLISARQCWTSKTKHITIFLVSGNAFTA